MRPNKLHQSTEEIYAANQAANIQGMRKDANINASNTQGILEEIRDKEVPEFPTEIATKTEIVGNRDEVASAFFSMLRGDKGDQGEVGPMGPQGEQGPRGESGQSIEGPQGVQGFTGEKGEQGEKGETGDRGLPGEDGNDGKDGSPDTGDEIIGKINEAENSILPKKIDGLEKMMKSVEDRDRNPVGGAIGVGGGPSKLKDLQDVRLTSPTDNQSLTYDSATGKWVNETVSGGSGTVETIVAGNNIDVDATDPANPIVSVETLTLADVSDITASATELNYVDGVTSAIQTQLNAKQGSITSGDTQVLFSDGVNNPAGDAGLTYNKTTDALTVAGLLTTPTIYGGTDIGSVLQLTGTSGVGTSTANAVQVMVGSNGATRAISVKNDGKVSIGSTGGYKSDKFLTVTDGASPTTTAGANGILVDMSGGGGIYMTGGAVQGKYEAYGSALGIGTMSNHPIELYMNNAKIFDATTSALKFYRAITTTNSTDSASVQVAIFEGDRATPAANDEAYLTFRLSDSVGTQTEFARLTAVVTDVTDGSEDGAFDFSALNNGVLTKYLRLNKLALSPSTNDVISLGVSGTAFSDLFLASGGVINWNAGNATLTHSAGLLTSNVPLSLGTSNALTAGTIELGATSDTTLSRSAAGVLAVEGVRVQTTTPLVVSAASYTTDTGTSLNMDNLDMFVITAQAGALLFNAPGGTLVQGRRLMIRIKDNGTARALTWNAVFRAMGTALPTTTVLSKTLYLGFIYNSTDTKWDLVASAQEA